MRHSSGPNFLLATALALGPMFVWAAHFGLVYLVDHMACTAFAASSDVWARPAIFIVTTAVLGLLPIWAWKAPPFLAHMVLSEKTASLLASVVKLLAALAIPAVVWVGAASLIFPACGSLR